MIDPKLQKAIDRVVAIRDDARMKYETACNDVLRIQELIFGLNAMSLEERKRLVEDWIAGLY